MKELIKMFLAFARIGGFTFGGGYAMLPMLQKEVVERYGWATESELMDYFAVGQCTPGVIAVNVATFIGYKKRGIPGAIFSTLGVITPSIIIITIIAALISGFIGNEYVAHALAGIRAVVCALILNAVIKFWKSGVKDILCGAIFVVALVLSIIFNVSPIIIVVGAAAIGVALTIAKGRKGGAENG